MQTLRETSSCLNQTGGGFLLVFHFRHHLVPRGASGQHLALDSLADALDIVVVINMLCDSLHMCGELFHGFPPLLAPHRLLQVPSLEGGIVLIMSLEAMLLQCSLVC